MNKRVYYLVKLFGFIIIIILAFHFYGNYQFYNLSFEGEVQEVGFTKVGGKLIFLTIEGKRNLLGTNDTKKVAKAMENVFYAVKHAKSYDIKYYKINDLNEYIINREGLITVIEKVTSFNESGKKSIEIINSFLLRDESVYQYFDSENFILNGVKNKIHIIDTLCNIESTNYSEINYGYLFDEKVGPLLMVSIPVQMECGNCVVLFFYLESDSNQVIFYSFEWKCNSI